MQNHDLPINNQRDLFWARRNLPSLDQLDIQLIEQLELDARQTYKELAVKLKVSSHTIASRVQRLLEGGAIKTVCWSDPISLGYNFRVMFAIYTQPGQDDNVADKLADSTHISAVHMGTGRFSIIAWALFRTGDDLSKFISQELKAIPEISHVETILTLQEIKISPRLLADHKETLNKECSDKSLDSLDRKLIEELQKDARQKNGQLARKLGVDQSTVFRRIQRLIDERIIHIGISTHPFALGYEGVATIGLKCDPGKVREVARSVASYKQVQYVGIYAGRYDIIAWVVFRKLTDLEHFVTMELGSISGLKDMETIVNYKLVKLLLQPPI